jgi:CBS domain-containing protein
MASFLDLFNATIGTITASKHELIEIKSSVTVKVALQLMITHQVTVLPIYQPPSASSISLSETEDVQPSAAPFVSQGKEYLGMVTLNDIVSFIINVYLNEAERIDDCFHTPVYEILGSSNESAIDRSLVIENEETPLSALIDKFCQGTDKSSQHLPPSNLSYVSPVLYRYPSLYRVRWSRSQSLHSQTLDSNRRRQISFGSN